MRLVTRGDLDGLACALIARHHDDAVDEVALVHPQAITDKTVEIRRDDFVANLPYAAGCGRWIDHHLLTPSNEQPPADFDGLYRVAPSAAQLVWEYYGEDPRFAELVAETNRVDSAQLTEADVLRPQGYVLLGFTVDPRTGLGDDDAYFHHCLRLLESGTLEQALLDPEVRQRILTMFEQNEDFCWLLAHESRLDGNVVITDFRRITHPPAGNRFLVYTLFPEANVSLRAAWGPDKGCVMLTVGHSIFNRTCPVSIGDLMSDYGGGGHRGAGSAPVAVVEADEKILEIVERLKDGA